MADAAIVDDHRAGAPPPRASPCGLHVFVRAAGEVRVTLARRFYMGRFLFWPSRLRVLERVWLRIGEGNGSVDVVGQVTEVYPFVGGAPPVRPIEGAQFSLTILRVDAALADDGPTLPAAVVGATELLEPQTTPEHSPAALASVSEATVSRVFCSAASTVVDVSPEGP